MSFRKRNLGLGQQRGQPDLRPGSSERTSDRPPGDATVSQKTTAQIPGVRPSPLDGRPTTSTGTPSLDGLLAGHAGFALGNSLLIEESGTTDYAGTLLRYFAAEGVVQGHEVLVVGVGEQWARELPGLVGPAGNEKGGEDTAERKEKMKIAWRYERFGEFGGGNGPRAPPVPNRSPSRPTAGSNDQSSPKTFCHSFDLTKRLTLPSPNAVNFVHLRPGSSQVSPFVSIIQYLAQRLSSSNANNIHRVIIPALLSPAIYPPHASTPTHVLQFLHSIRALLRQYPAQLSIMLTLPSTLYPRSTGLVRWIELLSDGVLELVPFPHSIDTGPSLTTSGAATAQEEKPQGLVKIHRLPVFHERGGGGAGGAGIGDDLAFTVSRRTFMIKPFSLPPVEGDTEAQSDEAEGGKLKVDIEF